MKELTLEEVLQIAGGLPLTAALDEITYRSQEGSSPGPIDGSRLLGNSPRSTEPA